MCTSLASTLSACDQPLSAQHPPTDIHSRIHTGTASTGMGTGTGTGTGAGTDTGMGTVQVQVQVANINTWTMYTLAYTLTNVYNYT